MQTSDQLIAEHKDEYGVYTSEEPNAALFTDIFRLFRHCIHVVNVEIKMRTKASPNQA